MAQNKLKTFIKGLSRSSYAIATFVLVMAGIVFVNIIFSFSVKRFDLTEDKLFSLSDATIDLLENDSLFNNPINIKVYLAGDLPADLEKIRVALSEKLSVFKEHAGSKLTYDFIDPNGFGSEEMNENEKSKIYNEGKGLKYSEFKIKSSGEIKVKRIWGGAVVEYNGKTQDYIQFFNPQTYGPEADLKSLASRAISNLEFKLIHSIRKTVQKKKKKLAFLHGHGELNKYQTGFVRERLRGKYAIKDISIDSNIYALQKMDGLVVAKPKEKFSERDKFVIDQFIMDGGKVFWFVDPLEVKRDSLYYNGRTFGLDAQLNLEDMFFSYGVRLEKQLIIDSVAAPIGVPQKNRVLEWIFYPRIKTDNTDHPITNNLSPIKTEYPSFLTPVGNDSIQKEVILRASSSSANLRSPVRIDFLFVERPPNFSRKNKKNKQFPIAMYLKGKFTSVFKNRITKEFTSKIEKTNYEYNEKSKENEMIVVADGDIIRNNVEQEFRGGKDRYKIYSLDRDIYGVKTSSGMPKYTYDNSTMIINMIDYVMDKHNLISVRSKKVKPRRIKEMTDSTKEFWSWLNLLFPIFFVTVIVALMYYDRKRKFVIRFKDQQAH